MLACMAAASGAWSDLSQHLFDSPAPVPLPTPGQVKGELIRLLTDIVARHQAARAQVTEEVVDAFMAVRPMHDAVAAAGRRR